MGVYKLEDEKMEVLILNEFTKNCLLDGKLSDAIFDALGNSSTVFLCVLDVEEDHARWTVNACKDFENIRENMHGTQDAWMKLVHPEDKKNIEIDLLPHLREQGCLTSKYRVRKRSGEYVWVRTDISLHNEEENSFVIAVIHELGAVTLVDSLTQLHNIYELDRNVEQHLICKGEHGALLYIGIDNFKAVNDRYTYAGGNEVLRTFSAAISKELPKESVLYRLDGDTFAVLYPNAGRDEVKKIFAMIQRTAEELRISGVDVIKLEVTGGAALYPKDGKSHGYFLRNAEYTLEKAKMVRRNGLLFFSKEMWDETVYNMQLIECLEESVQKNFQGFELHFQPIVNSETNRIIECETLLRWNHPNYPGIRPAEFVPLLESSGLMIDVGKWVLENGIHKGKEWSDIYGSIVMNVNVSYVQMEQEDFCEYVLEMIDKCKFSPELLVLELTESCRVRDMSGLCKMMKKLREHKISVALDDFGTGYASLSVLRDVPVDWVKIDHNFVKQCKNDKVDRSIVKHIIMLAHSIGVKVCVEGIENEDIHSVATEEAADTLQGYFFGRPVRAEEFETMIRKQESQWNNYGYGPHAICW